LYCYNNSLVYTKEGNYSFFEILEFLKSRVGLLDAVVLSGGEASLYDLEIICKKIKELGFKIKLDTNGTNLNLVKNLTKKGLVDFIAIDFKAPKYKFFQITATNFYEKVIDTIKYLIKIGFDFELRTTINTRLLDEKDINDMIECISCLNYKGIYYLQNFIETSSNIGNIKKSRAIDKSLIDSKNLIIQYRN
jgi:pyruvate formate lyase activating enzyme